MIKAPKKSEGKAAARALIEAFAQGTPVTAGLAHFYGYTHPSQFEQDIESWRGEITDLVNEHADQIQKHEAVLNPTVTIKGVTAKVAEQLVKSSTDGWNSKIYTVEDLIKLLPDFEESKIEESFFELEHYGLVDLVKAMNVGPRVRASLELYVQVDQHIMGWNTVEDAKSLAQMILEDEACWNVQTLHERTGWSLRRLNPPVWYLKRFFPDGRLRNVCGRDYPTFGFAVAGEDRHRLKQFIGG